MKAIKFFTGLAALGMALSIGLNTMAGEPGSPVNKFKVADKSSVKWVGKKVAGEHYGSVQLKSGTIEMTGGKLTGGSFEMDMTSITCEDLDGEWSDKLVGHLKSDDFFGVNNYNTAKLNVKKVTPAGSNKYNVLAHLTIKGKTHPVEFPVTVSDKNGNVKAAGTITVDRTKYGIRYGSDSFFDNLGDKAIENNFTLSFELKAS